MKGLVELRSRKPRFLYRGSVNYRLIVEKWEMLVKIRKKFNYRSIIDRRRGTNLRLVVNYGENTVPPLPFL